MTDYVMDYNEQLSELESYRESKKRKLPMCDKCLEPIFDEHFYEVDGLYICPDCMDGCRRLTEDYTEGGEVVLW